MTDYQSWRPPYRAVCPEPGPLDMFIVTFVNGKRMWVNPVSDYQRIRASAERIAEKHEQHWKVLPVSGSELMNFLGIKPAPPQPIANLDPAFREQAVKNCMDVLRGSSGERERGEALELLGHLGVLQ